MKHKTYLKNETIYQVYVRNHTKEGTFKALIKDLDRIKDLGVSTIYLVPIHPIGEKERKGTLGSPYAIRDYYAINEELGTLDDFKLLIQETHNKGLKLMIDIVLHHTSPDSVLLKSHPAFYFYKNGKLGNKVGDWSDIIDFDYTNKDLWVYMKDMLLYWAQLGVDGFRADVAPMIPIEFWNYVRTELDNFNDKIMWLSESVEPSFLTYLRSEGHLCHSDVELYSSFDMLYDYDTYPILKAYFNKEASLQEYVDAVNYQILNYPKNYLKIRTLENHDTLRVYDICHANTIITKNITAFSFFNDGIGFIYAGQEYKAQHRPDLFNKDTVKLSTKDKDFTQFIVRLIDMKKDKVFSNVSRFTLATEGEVITGTLLSNSQIITGFFNLSGNPKTINTTLDDGDYHDLIANKKVVIEGHKLIVDEPLILKRSS